MFRTDFNQVKPTPSEMAALRHRAMQHPRAQKLAYWWILGEGAGLRAYDVTGKHHLEIPTAGNTWTMERNGPALVMDGTNNDPSAYGKPTANIANAYTLSAQVKRNASADNDSKGQILTHDRPSGTDDRVWAFFIANSGRTLRFQRYNAGGTLIETISGSTALTDGTRYSVGATFSAVNGSRVYREGRIDGTGASTTANRNPGVGTESYRLGTRNLGTTGMLHGIIDNARLWSRELTPEEMWSLFQWPYMEFVEAAQQLNRVWLIPFETTLEIGSEITNPSPIQAPGIITTGLRVMQQFPEVGSTRMRIFEAELGANHVYVVKATKDSARIYSPVSTGGELKGSVLTTIPLIGCSALFLLDTHMLRDEDDNAGFYMAVIPESGDPDDWNGAVVFRSTDGGATWQEIASHSVAVSAVGLTTTALGDTTHRKAWDFANTVTVNLSFGTLQSTDFPNAYAGVNTALIGSELVTFRTVTPEVGSRQVTLSDLIRGRRGTEPFTGSHAAGELFIMMDDVTELIRHIDPASVLNTERLYQAQSFNQVLEGCAVVPFTNTGLGLKPYAPGHLTATRDGSSNITFVWNRRSRVVGTWTLTRDAPLSEATEAYELDIYDPTFTTFKRTIEATSETAGYSIADQTTDFGGAQDPVGVDLFQLSATVGRGYVKRALV